MTSTTSRPADPAHRGTAYRFGAFELQPGERRLMASGEPIALGPRAFDVLVALAARAGELVAKDELLELAWPGLVVEENNLQVQVSALRKVLGPEAIATVSGRGYRFTPDVRCVHGETGSRRPLRKLPRPLTRFIGRDEVLVEYARVLERTRLLTLTGIGGCGKTRLAAELAGRLLPRFADGVCFVDLAAVADEERLGVSLAGALEAREEPGVPLAEVLERHVARRELLLVLDNCEHLLDACSAWLTRLLAAGAALRALVTSREALGVAGESIVRVPSLGLPAEAEKDMEAIGRCASVQLFVDRAQQVVPEFALSVQNAEAVAEICRRLDGIPLAIELAAARVKVLSPEQIRGKLDDRFRLLTGGSRALPRHQTLVAVLKWSYEHLAADEQRLLGMLSIFPGGAILASMRAVAGPDADELALLESLDRLVDKSLVLVDREPAAGPRYRLLETVRQYAEERLCDTEEHATLRERHLAHFLALAAQWHADVAESRHVREWVERMDAELPNVLAAHAYCDCACDGAEQGLALATRLRLYWLHHGLFTLGQQVYERALSRPGAQQRTMARAQALFALGQHHYFQWRLREVVAPCEEALAIAREHGDAYWTAISLMRLATVRGWLGDAPWARAAAEQACAIAQTLGEARILGHAYASLGEVCRACGDFEGAAAAYDKCLAFDGRAHSINEHTTYLNLARVAIARRDYAESGRMLVRSIANLREMGPSHHGHYALYVASRLAAVQSQWERAARLRGAADAAVAARGGVSDGQDDNLTPALSARLHTMAGEPGLAAAYLQGRESSIGAALEEVVAWLENPAPPAARTARARRSSAVRGPSVL